MRVIVLNTEYPAFLDQFWAADPSLASRSWSEQMQVRMASGFGVTDAYSDAFRQLGHEAIDIHANNQFAQHAWARQHAPRLIADIPMPAPGQVRMPWTCKRAQVNWPADVLVEQVRQYQPDLVLNHGLETIATELLVELRPCVKWIVGQHAATQLDPARDFGVYDLCVSSFPPTVEWFRQHGVRAELNRLAFDGRVLAKLPDVEPCYDVTFVGSFFDVHKSRTRLIEEIARHFPLRVWGPPPDGGFGDSPLAECYQGIAWGLEMLTVLKRSRVTINHHGDVPPYANNLRLYEATGVGAALLTDWKANLHEMLEPGVEVAAYRDIDDCLQRLHELSRDEPKRAQMAQRGQQRTLRDHTFLSRIQQLMQWVETLPRRS